MIADGVDPELDDLRRIALHGKDYLARIQQRESETTGIPSLKISYNNVFGYYIEVRNAHKDKVPQTWIRKQTLANAERYITEELKEYEEKILGAEEKMLVIEQRIYADIIACISRSLAVLLRDAAVVARVDCLQSFARIACERRYVRPVLDDGKRIDIRQGRHPVIETLMPVGEEYIPNDVLLDDKEQQIMMITGPNMSGKSALLRQTALIILMAQMGSFVPAKSAHIGVVDKIFTRVGASDNISQGESTFMVEMLESASILNNISDRSIVLLDEIGRGTSTYDGISIAWAMVEYLHNHPTAHAKTLFATHYHELNEMEQMCPRVKNYHVSVKELGNQIVFLRKLERGGTEHSFGIHVARMAGMPVSIVSRADEILRNLELVYGNNEIVPSRSLKERGRKSAAQAVKEAAARLGKAPQKRKVIMVLPDPVIHRHYIDTTSSTTYWGALDGQQLDFSRNEDRIAACKWYIDRVRERFAQGNYEHVELAGFYWLREIVTRPVDTQYSYHLTRSDIMLPHIADYLHKLDYTFSWIPYYGSRGYDVWQQFGFDQVYLQPNYYWKPQNDMDEVCRQIDSLGIGMEIEFEPTLLDAREGSGTFRARLRDYIDYAKRRNIYGKRPFAYYHGTNGFYDLYASDDEADRELFDELCRFIINNPLRAQQPKTGKE